MQQRFVLATTAFAIALSACGTNPAPTAGTGAAPQTASTTAAGETPSTTAGAFDAISAAASTSDALDALLNPGASVANANTLNPNAANPNHVADPNRQACDAALKQLQADQDALRKSADFTAVLNSAALKTVQTDIDALRKADCHDIVAPSAACQTLITQFDTDLQAFWKSPELATLEASAPYLAVQADAKLVGKDCAFHGRP